MRFTTDERVQAECAVERPSKRRCEIVYPQKEYILDALPVRFAPGIERDRLARRLGERGIPARPYFLPIHLQPYMVERFAYRPGDFPITEDLGRRGLALPFSGVMTEEMVDTVCQELAGVLSS